MPAARCAGRCGPFSFASYGTKLVLVRGPSNAAHQQADRLRDRDPRATGDRARAALHRGPDCSGNAPGWPDGLQIAQATASPGTGAVHARRIRRLSARAGARGDQRRTDSRCARRTGGTHGMRERGQSLPDRAHLPRRAGLAARESGDPPLAAGDHIGRAGRTVFELQPLGAGSRYTGRVWPLRGPRPQARATMSTVDLDALVKRSYQHGFVTDIDSDTVPPGLDEDVVRLISRKKGEPQFLLDWRLKALRHWYGMREPHWAHLRYAPIDYTAISYYSAPKRQGDGPKTLAEVDPKLLATYDRLGVPLHERARLAGVAVDAVFDSVSVATTFKEKLSAAGALFCPF